MCFDKWFHAVRVSGFGSPLGWARGRDNLPPHMREGGTLENVAGERPTAARTIAPHRIFAQTNPITQPGVYE